MYQSRLKSISFIEKYKIGLKMPWYNHIKCLHDKSNDNKHLKIIIMVKEWYESIFKIYLGKGH